jgi:hypothetical protein
MFSKITLLLAFQRAFVVRTCSHNIKNNQYVLDRIAQNNLLRNHKIVEELRTIAPALMEDDDELLKIYNKCVSMHQRKIQGNGDFLENDIVVGLLDTNGIAFRRQVTINGEGVITGFHERRRKCHHVIDFVIGDDIRVGKSIVDYKVISCKTTCRERWRQDDWTHSFAPKLYILLTISDDYPPASRFRENEQRKIVTCLPKKKDDRKYKLGFDDLINVLRKTT